MQLLPRLCRLLAGKVQDGQFLLGLVPRAKAKMAVTHSGGGWTGERPKAALVELLDQVQEGDGPEVLNLAGSL
eukprot:7461598-Alexandrium_andersonii.AAC.1